MQGVRSSLVQPVQTRNGVFTHSPYATFNFNQKANVGGAVTDEPLAGARDGPIQTRMQSQHAVSFESPKKSPAVEAAPHQPWENAPTPVPPRSLDIDFDVDVRRHYLVRRPNVFIQKKFQYRHEIAIPHEELQAKFSQLLDPLTQEVKRFCELKCGHVDYEITCDEDLAYLACALDRQLRRVDPTMRVVSVGNQNSYQAVNARKDQQSSSRTQMWLFTVWVNKRRDDVSERQQFHNLLMRRSEISDLYVCNPAKKDAKPVNFMMSSAEAMKIANQPEFPAMATTYEWIPLVDCVMEALPKKREEDMVMLSRAVSLVAQSLFWESYWVPRLTEFKYPLWVLQA